jgi:hypothetical protein
LNGSPHSGEMLYTNDAGREDGFAIDIKRLTVSSTYCDHWGVANTGESDNKGTIRCYRQQ